MKALAAILCATMSGLVCVPVVAGPVPGVETIEKREVDFPTPPSIEAWETIDGDYLVTFRWKPDGAADKASIAGSFNNWNANDLPLSGPDETGGYSVTARIPAGVHQYKIVHDGNWIADPANPQRDDDGHGGSNSILKLGLFAKHENLTAARGDGEMIAEAFLHDAREPLYCDIVSAGEIFLRFRTLHDDVTTVSLVLTRVDNEFVYEASKPLRLVANDDTYDYWETVVSSDSCMTVETRYTFQVHDGDAALEYEKAYSLPQNALRSIQTPEWARDAVWYQIMVDRFRDGDPANNAEQLQDPKRPQVTHPWRSDWEVEQPYEREGGYSLWRWSVYNRLYGGDFAGVVEKLDYLKSLGVTAIYLNPVFEAHTPHKYNARDYIHADDGYGKAGEYAQSAAREDLLDSSTWEFNESDKMLLRLIDEVHARGMRVIFDGVFNHVGDDHPAFLDVQEKGRDSRYADWFHIESWEPFKYRGWGGFGGLPEFAKTPDGLVSESLTTHIYDVTKRWMDPNGDGDPSDGIDGWRLDVPNELPKQFWVDWREHVKSINPEAYIVGEIWDPAEQWLDGTTFDAVMNYQVSKIALQWFGNREKKINASEFDNRLARLRIRYPQNHTYVLQNLFDSHDTDRWVSRLMNPDLSYDAANRMQDGAEYNYQRPNDEAYARLKLMALFQATYIGAPMIYYGTENGMFGADDPHNRLPMWWEDHMPFDNPEYRIDSELRDYFRELFFLRHQCELLRRGRIQTAVADDAKDVYGFYRFDSNSPQALLVLLNNSSSPQVVDIDPPAEYLGLIEFRDFVQLNGQARVELVDGKMKIELAPVGGTVIQFGRGKN